MRRHSSLHVHYCMSLIGCRFQMVLGHTFVFGNIGLRRKKTKYLKTKKTLKTKNLET